MPTTEFGAGQHDRLGATVVDGGVNFALFSYHATEVDLLLFDRPDAAQPSKVFRSGSGVESHGQLLAYLCTGTQGRPTLRISPQRTLYA